MSPGEANGWSEWQNHVLAELKRLSDGVESVDRDMGGLRVEVAKLQVKAGAWGALGALAVVIGSKLLE